MLRRRPGLRLHPTHRQARRPEPPAGVFGRNNRADVVRDIGNAKRSDTKAREIGIIIRRRCSDLTIRRRSKRLNRPP